MRPWVDRLSTNELIRSQAPNLFNIDILTNLSSAIPNGLEVSLIFRFVFPFSFC